MRALLLTLPLLGLVPAAAATARPQPEVQRFLQEEITKMVAVQKNEHVGVDGNYGTMAGDYVFSLFRLRIVAEFGFDVGLARVTVVPQAEFFWE